MSSSAKQRKKTLKTAVAAAEEATKRQRVDLLCDVHAAHAAYGAKHDEFRRYREYCARRLRRIRRATKATCGRTRFRAPDNPTPEQTRRDPRHALLLLVEAERAWAYWMELKAPLAREASSDVHAREHYHMLRRVKKAAAWAAKLERLCAEACDARTQAEAMAYAAWMRGNATMELRRWAEAHSAFALATNICERLAAALPADKQQVLRERIEETEPKLRFCQHNLRLASTAATAAAAAATTTITVMPEALVKLLEIVAREAAEERKAERNAEIDWRGVAVPVRIARVRQLLTATDRDGAHLSEAMQLLREAANKKKPDPAVRPLLDYVAWRRNEHTAARCIDAIRATTAKQQQRPEELVRLYDAAIAAVADAAALIPGAPGAEQQEYAKQYAAKGLSLKAERCLQVAATYERAGKWAEADAMLAQTLRRVADAKAHHADCAKPLAEAIAALDTLERQARVQRCIVQARAAAPSAAASTATEETAAASTAVADAPDVWSDDAERPLAQLNPEPELVPLRPFFFNIASTELEFPNLEARKQPPKKGGFFGFWR